MTGDSTKRLVNQSGYSLVELLTTVAIFGVLVASAIPHIDTRRENINTSVKQVVADYRWARSRAITSGKHFSIRWIDSQNYQVQRHEQGASGDWPVESVVRTASLPSNISFDVWPTTNEFNTRGMMVDPNYALWSLFSDSEFDTYRLISIWPSGQIYAEW